MTFHAKLLKPVVSRHSCLLQCAAMSRTSTSLLVVVITFDIAEITALSLLAVTVNLLLAFALLGGGGSFRLWGCFACRRHFSLLSAVSGDKMLNWTSFLPTLTTGTRGSAASGALLAMLDKELMQRVLKIIRNACLAMSESGLAIDGRLTLLSFLWHPAEVLAEAEDVGINSERRALQTEEQNT